MDPYLKAMNKTPNFDEAAPSSGSKNKNYKKEKVRTIKFSIELHPERKFAGRAIPSARPYQGFLGTNEMF